MKRSHQEDESVNDYYSDSDSAPEETTARVSTGKPKKTNKHAPKETRNIHRPVSVVRDIPGLEVKNRESGLYGDVRFEKALGKEVDYEVVRKQYAFLDELREKEIAQMESILKDRKMLSRMTDGEIEDLKYRLQSTKSKLETLRRKDKEKEALKRYMREQKKESGGKFLTRAEKRKVVLVDRFENMNTKQKNKSIERKRKRKLGKEMRAMEFRQGNRS
ncbi:hypothetical protein CAS74_003958 [Pichia kudriavzevii]|uniref:rRNA biogenesis protein RRP36 n=1 Tax=Pichia kudriavzevii TaxID=4909 RepID=A0A099P3D1_PICKU|nr:uncharacterized protein C5L36_0B08740 [Pichia kudriavzevii]AWU75631.1 hypothetical protein C5L36_0B08740 [Pichia kudriavzevii]KGK39395.1 hypothetical protein JL09_g1390 [Pichia kudriavzevii]ONH77094.1 rRNA biogenesis protein RRP36 [Pichia kudriavzevii]OUT20962.1 hypothetical protein CAS74_003958 [Pichia kudriavzevii]